MSSIFTSGYGYSKNLCQDIASWFLEKYFPRHKLEIDIVHRGMKREGVFGWCDISSTNTSRPRKFLIEMQTGMDRETYIKTLLHELTHVAQWIRGDLKLKHGKLCYSHEPVENYAYDDQPHEIEAREQEEKLYLWYLNDRKIVSVKEVSHGFGNRLCSPVY
jgi:hypothetical protein